MFGKKKEPSLALIEKPLNPLVKAGHIPERRGHAVITQVIVHFDCGFGNNLFIRGEGASLKWDEGILLRNVKPSQWFWETHEPFDLCQFKILINDCCYEQGDNHLLSCGKVLVVEPIF